MTMTRKMSEIYVKALVISLKRSHPKHEMAHSDLVGNFMQLTFTDECLRALKLADRIAARLVDRMMSRPHRSVSDIAKAHGMATHADNSEINLGKRFEDDMEEGRR